MLIRSIKLQNLLSFGPDAQELELKPLNVLIGPNGSGKSNLIEAVSLLQAAPQDLAATIREGGGVHDWIWQGDSWNAVRPGRSDSGLPGWKPIATPLLWLHRERAAVHID